MNDNSADHKDAGSTVNKQSQLVVVDIPGSDDPVIVEARKTRHEPRKTLIWLVESESDMIDLIVRENVIDTRTDAGREAVEEVLTDGSGQSTDAHEDTHTGEKRVMTDGGVDGAVRRVPTEADPNASIVDLQYPYVKIGRRPAIDQRLTVTVIDSDETGRLTPPDLHVDPDDRRVDFLDYIWAALVCDGEVTFLSHVSGPRDDVYRCTETDTAFVAWWPDECPVCGRGYEVLNDGDDDVEGNGGDR